MEDRFHQKKYPHNIKMPDLYYIHLQFALPALSLVLVVPDSDNHSAYSLDSVDYPILLRTSSSHKNILFFLADYLLYFCRCVIFPLKEQIRPDEFFLKQTLEENIPHLNSLQKK